MRNKPTAIHLAKSATPRRWQRVLSFSVALAVIVTSVPPPASAAIPPLPSTTPSLDLHHLDLTTLMVPESLGRIVEAWQPTDQEPTALIFHVQDLHAHPQAQAAQSRLIAYLHQHLGVSLVAVEGAQGLCDTKLYSDLPDPPSTERIATLFRDEGLFTGAEYAAITHPNEVTVWGVDDERLYLEHWLTSQGEQEQGSAVHETLTQLHETLAPVVARLYPKPLQHLSTLRSAYDQTTVESAFQRYVEELVRVAWSVRIDMAAYPTVQITRQLREIAKTLDMRRVGQEREQLLVIVRPRLPPQAQDRLDQLAQAAVAREIPEGAYDEALALIAHAHGVLDHADDVQPSSGTASALHAVGQILLPHVAAQRTYRTFQQYLRYLALVKQVRSTALSQEVLALHEAIDGA